MLVILSQGVSNFANDYMSYPTKLLCKASKLIVIMIVGRCIIGRQYHALEVIAPTALQHRLCYMTVCLATNNYSCCRLQSVWPWA